MVYTLVFDLIVPETAVQWCAFFYRPGFSLVGQLCMAVFNQPGRLLDTKCFVDRPFWFYARLVFSGMIMPCRFSDWIQRSPI